MALYVRQDDKRSELQQRVAADLREKLKNEKQVEYEKPTSTFVDGTHESQNLGPVLILVGAVLVLGLGYILMSR